MAKLQQGLSVAQQNGSDLVTLSSFGNIPTRPGDLSACSSFNESRELVSVPSMSCDVCNFVLASDGRPDRVLSISSYTIMSPDVACKTMTKRSISAFWHSAYLIGFLNKFVFSNTQQKLCIAYHAADIPTESIPLQAISNHEQISKRQCGIEPSCCHYSGALATHELITTPSFRQNRGSERQWD